MGEAKRRAAAARPKVGVYYDTNPALPDEGGTYFHCIKCLDELPDGASPESWAQQQMAIRTDGYFQLRCVRHKCNIAVITFKVKEPGDG